MKKTGTRVSTLTREVHEHGDLQSGLMRVVMDCVRSTGVVFKFPAGIWVGQKRQKIVALQCGQKRQK